MGTLHDRVAQAVERIRSAGTDLFDVEAKSAEGGAPKRLPQTVSAFANADGGLLILGLDEKKGFAPVGGDPSPWANALASACNDSVEPPIRAEIDIVRVDGVPIAVAEIPALEPSLKPCFVRAQGLNGGSYTRGHDGNRRLTTYEIHVLLAGRGQPRDDVDPVLPASRADFDPSVVAHLLDRLRRTRGPVFAEKDEGTILRMVGALSPEPATDTPTLAGLLCLGRYPQQFLPQLNITFVAYPSIDSRPLPDGTRFLDNQAIDGPIPLMVDMAEKALIRNMTRRAVIDGLGREDVWEYPLLAVRELIVNAIMHRDYHPLAQGAQIRLELYPDRLVVASPGGLHGGVDVDALTRTPTTSTRNASLARLMEDVEMPRSDRTVAENRGTGLITVSAELERAGMPPALFKDTLVQFSVTLRRREDTVRLDATDRAGSALHLVGFPQPRMPKSVEDAVKVQANVARAMVERLPQGLKTMTSRQAEVLQLLGDQIRPASDLAKAMGVTRQAVQKHLRALEGLNLVAPTANRHSKLVEWRAVESE